MSHKFYWGWAVIFALLATGGVVHGQNPPEPAPTPQVAPEPPEPPEAPEPAESLQAFVLNDGSAHLGVSLSDVTAQKAQELKLPAVAGALVDSVQKDSAAAKAGLVKGDAIMEFDGVRVRSSAELRRLIRETPTGRTVEMKVVRDGKTRILNATLQGSARTFNLNAPEARLPSISVMPDINLPPMSFSLSGNHRATLGISGDDLSPQLAEYFGVKQGKGVLISEVTKGGAADKAGLKAGDVIVQVDGKAIGGVEELRSALNDNFTDDTRKVSLTFVRDRHEQTVNAELTRSSLWEERTSSATARSYAQAMAELKRAQANQQIAQAKQLRDLAEQRAQLQAQVAKQQQQIRAEWQRQVQQQLRDQLRHAQDFRDALRQNNEI